MPEQNHNNSVAKKPRAVSLHSDVPRLDTTTRNIFRVSYPDSNSIIKFFPPRNPAESDGEGKMLPVGDIREGGRGGIGGRER